MKTLDEVIEALKWCIDDSHDDCDGCPYDTGEVTDCHERNIDALLYLKEYQERQENLDQFETYQFDQNRPLSWNELRQMEGKPVWVDAGKFGSHWYLIEEICQNETIVCLGKFHESITLYHEDILTYWQAYRKERK